MCGDFPKYGRNMLQIEVLAYPNLILRYSTGIVDRLFLHVEVSINPGTPKYRCFIVGIPIYKWMSGTPISGNLHIIICEWNLNGYKWYKWIEIHSLCKHSNCWPLVSCWNSLFFAHQVAVDGIHQPEDLLVPRATRCWGQAGLSKSLDFTGRCSRVSWGAFLAVPKESQRGCFEGKSPKGDGF